MAHSSDRGDHETEYIDDEEADSEYVVTPEQIREGDFKTLNDARDDIDATDE